MKTVFVLFDKNKNICGVYTSKEKATTYAKAILGPQHFDINSWHLVEYDIDSFPYICNDYAS